MRNEKTTLSTLLIFNLDAVHAADISNMSTGLSLSSWPVWLGAFAFIVIMILFANKKIKTDHARGHFDTPIHQKPFFKVASLVIILMFFGMLLV